MRLGISECYSRREPSEPIRIEKGERKENKVVPSCTETRKLRLPTLSSGPHSHASDLVRAKGSHSALVSYLRDGWG
jgi:hypothetical protein